MNSTPVPFITLAVAIFVAAAAAAAATIIYVTSWGGNADAITTGVAVASVVLLVGTIFAAFATVHQQQTESQRQRQMETVRHLTDAYEKIFHQIYALRGATPPDDERDRIYNQYFTALKRGHRCYVQGFVPRIDFEDWTITALTRFARGGSLLNVDDNSGSDEFARQFHNFEKRAAGMRDEFGAYMSVLRREAVEEAKHLAYLAAQTEQDDPGRGGRMRERAKRVLASIENEPDRFWILGNSA